MSGDAKGAVLASSVIQWVVAIEMRMRSRSLEAFQSGSIHKKDIQPAIIVVIEERHTAAGRFKKILVRFLAPVDRPCFEPCFFSSISEEKHQVIRLHKNRNPARNHECNQ